MNVTMMTLIQLLYEKNGNDGCEPYIQRVGQKSKPDNFCNNFVYCHPIFFIIFGTCTLQEICNWRIYS